MHDRQVDVILRSKNWPFRTKGDVLRWCVVRGLRVLEAMEPTITSKGFMQQADAIQDMLRDELYMQEYMSMFEKLQEVCSKHVAMNCQSEAVRLIAQVKHKIDSIEGEPNWKRKCQVALQERFGYLMNQRGVGLGSGIVPVAEVSNEEEIESNEYKV